MLVRDLTLKASEYKGRPTHALGGECPCRPCFNAHDCGRFNSYTGKHETRMECATRYSNGCPYPIPEPQHVYRSERARLPPLWGEGREKLLINKRYKPWLACATDDSRPVLACVSIERADGPLWHPDQIPDHSLSGVGLPPRRRTPDYNGVAVAADGYMLVVVPVTLDDDEAGCLVHRDVWKYALRLGSQLSLRLGTAEDTHITLGNLWKAPKIEAKFPLWRDIVRQSLRPEAPTEGIAFDPRFLHTLYSALGGEHGTQLHLRGATAPIIVTPLGAALPPHPPFGVLMPMHVDVALAARKRAATPPALEHMELVG